MDPIKILTDAIGEDYETLLTSLHAIVKASSVTDERVVFLNDFLLNEFILIQKK